jgi:hypothetical protein
MKTEATLVAPTSLTAIRPFVSDLGEYARWMPLVHKATTAGPGAWDVELRAKLGPFARSKRLRMERTTDSPQLIVFERREKEGREHAPRVVSGRGGGRREALTGWFYDWAQSQAVHWHHLNSLSLSVPKYRHFAPAAVCTQVRVTRRAAPLAAVGAK